MLTNSGFLYDTIGGQMTLPTTTQQLSRETTQRVVLCHGAEDIFSLTKWLLTHCSRSCFHLALEVNDISLVATPYLRWW